MVHVFWLEVWTDNLTATIPSRGADVLDLYVCIHVYMYMCVHIYIYIAQVGRTRKDGPKRNKSLGNAVQPQHSCNPILTPRCLYMMIPVKFVIHKDHEVATPLHVPFF